MGVQSQRVQSGRDLFEGLEKGIFEALGRLPSGLMLDVGAATGLQARTMIRNSPDSTILAFEPFEGNWKHFQTVIDGTASLWEAQGGAHSVADKVTLIKKAVCDHTDGVTFFVGHTVPANAAGTWAHFEGYSSVGRIVEAEREKASTVSSTTIDIELGDREAVFAKVDVQGAEPAVLRGAERAIAEGRILAWQIEYRGQPEILDMLSSYVLFDSEYMIVPRDDTTDLSAWDITSEMVLSTGKSALKGWPKAMPEDYSAFFLEERGRMTNLETDLIAVTSDLVDTFTK